MRKRVARSWTAFSFSPLSAGTRRPSSSLRERCSASPCLATSSLHVPRSSSFSERLRMVPWSSLLSAGEGVPSSSSPESSVERRGVVLRARRGGGRDGGAGRAARRERCLGEGGGPPAPQQADGEGISLNGSAWLSSAGCRQGGPRPSQTRGKKQSPRITGRAPQPPLPPLPAPHLAVYSPPTPCSCSGGFPSVSPAQRRPTFRAPPGDPQATVTAPPCCCRAPRRARPCLPVGSCVWRHRPWPLNGLIRQGLCHPWGIDRRWGSGR